MDTLSEKKANNLRKYITNAVGALVILFFTWYLYQNQDILTHLKNISWKQIMWIVLCDLATFLINGLLDQSMINRLDNRVSFLDCYLLGYASNFLNKILPTIGGGAAFRAAYLKRKYQFPYSQFVSTVAGLYVISFFSTSLIGLFCLWVIFVKFAVFSWVICLIFLAICLSCLFIIIFSPKIPEGDHRIIKILNGIFEGWRIIKMDPKFIFIYAFLSVTILFLSAMQTFFSYQALGVKTDIVSMLFLSTLGIILAFLNFTPDGIGVKEAVYIFSSDLVRIPNGLLILGSLILRGISLCTTFIIGGICYLFLARKLNKSIEAVKR
jgi:uncharacterized protein (TIRG00374 family)